MTSKFVMKEAHASQIQAVVDRLKSDVVNGLDDREVGRRRLIFGDNRIVESGRKTALTIAWEQVSSTLIVVLIAAAIVSAVLGDFFDAAAIGAIVLLNAVLGFFQEYRAEEAIAALRQLAVPTVRVRRSGIVEERSALELAPGDIVLLEAGNKVPADGRLIESATLKIDEAALTGESEASLKDAFAKIDADTDVGSRVTMAFQGTSVVQGRGVMVVTATGMESELGKIASMLQAIERDATPLQKRLDRLGKWISVVALAIVSLIFLMGLPGVDGFDEIKLLFLTAVSLAVAAVPEGLPAVVTIALSVGSQRMLKRGALIRNLPAVETLGSVTAICSDKTGTLTRNEMTVAVVDVAGGRLEMNEAANGMNEAVSFLLAAGDMCNDATLTTETTNGVSRTVSVGDPTETAIAVAAANVGINKLELETALPRVSEVPFDSVRKRMTTVHLLNDSNHQRNGALRYFPQDALEAGSVSFTKGAIDSVLEISSGVWFNGRFETMNDDWRLRIQSAHDELAAKGMRVLGVGFRPQANDADDYESEITFLGILGIIDPPRDEARLAVSNCKAANIRPLMITGDHPLTAKHIASELGIESLGGVMTGRELDKLEPTQLSRAAKDVSVFARVSPNHKLHLVEQLQQQGEVVAMTGDGVNDAPALKRADIGVAMGITGSDVSKEAADIVLLDDNFATIVAAIEQGRILYDNIRKFIRYLLSANAGELWVMFLGPLFGMPLPLRPLQILWINLVTDGFPALALGVEPAERDVMKRPPVRPNESIFARGVGIDIIWIGLLMAAVSLGVGGYYLMIDAPQWQTMLFTTMTLSQIALALAIRSDKHSIFQIGLFSNRSMIAAVLLTTVLQLGVIYIPFLNDVFRTTPLGLADLTVAIALSTIVFWFVELRKLITRLRLPSEKWIGNEQ